MFAGKKEVGRLFVGGFIFLWGCGFGGDFALGQFIVWFWIFFFCWWGSFSIEMLYSGLI